MKKLKHYVVFYLYEEDTPPAITLMDKHQIAYHIEKYGQEGMAIVEGNLIKSFDNKIDWKGL